MHVLLQKFALKLDKYIKIGHYNKMKSRSLVLLYITLLTLYYISYYILFSLFCTKDSHADDQIRVAIVDTGLDLKDPRFEGHICKTGHKSYVQNETPDDVNGHGTSVASLIQEYAKDSNYCFLIYKYYRASDPGLVNLRHEVFAFQDAIANGADIVNFSGGGPEFDEQEFLVIKDNPQVIFIVAAGNDHLDLDNMENDYYPATYALRRERLKNIFAVKNIDKDGTLAVSSNYSKFIEANEIGVNVLTFLPNMKMGYRTGTSMSAAIHTGKAICKMSKHCK